MADEGISGGRIVIAGGTGFLGLNLARHLFMRTDPELVLYGRYCVPKRLLEEGLEFAFEDAGAALDDLCRRKSG